MPIQGMPTKPTSATSSYKTYKVKRDPYMKKVKETLSKPAAVPLDQFVGLTFLASKDKTKLISKLTSKASAVVDSYADVSPLEASPETVAEAAAAFILPLSSGSRLLLQIKKQAQESGGLSSFKMVILSGRI